MWQCIGESIVAALMPQAGTVNILVMISVVPGSVVVNHWLQIGSCHHSDAPMAITGGFTSCA